VKDPTLVRLTTILGVAQFGNLHDEMSKDGRIGGRTIRFKKELAHGGHMPDFGFDNDDTRGRDIFV